MKWEQSLLTNVDLLSTEDCARVRSGVDSLRDLWIQRHPTIPLYTLGASHTFDLASDPKRPYYAMVRDVNPVMMREFGWLYDSLASSLQELFGLPVEYPAKLALPGFHIMLAHEAMKTAQGLMYHEWSHKKEDPSMMSSPIHADQGQYVVDWTGIDDVSKAQPLSITMPVGLPESGAGMLVWDLRLTQTVGMPEPQIRALLQQRKSWLHEYQLGRYCLHSGLQYHQIAPFKEVSPNDVRITLQGHGLIGKNSIKVYW